jgi:hypothetical protein
MYRITAAEESFHRKMKEMRQRKLFPNDSVLRRVILYIPLVDGILKIGGRLTML